MNNNNLNTNISPLFNLYGLKAAKVSEISEATASSPLPKEERVNFHIGNPVQDKRLEDLYLRMVLKLNNDGLLQLDTDSISKKLGLSGSKVPYVNILKDAIQKSVPYMPRGGFNKNDPNKLIKLFSDWLNRDQQEPLYYDLGDQTGNRECIIASGGIIEALRIFLHSISGYLKTLPAQIFGLDVSLPEHLKQYDGLDFEEIIDENTIQEVLNYHYAKTDNRKPTFLLLGKLINEKTRRHIREISLKHPLFIIELNDAPNHLSLAREAIMMNRVLRFITPSVLTNESFDSSLVFLAGNSDYLKLFDTIHFQLKGTPSASEVVFHEYLLNESISTQITDKKDQGDTNPGITSKYSANSWLDNKFIELGNRVSEIFESYDDAIQEKVRHVNELTERITAKTMKSMKRGIPLSDKFLALSAEELLDELLGNLTNRDWRNDLEESFLASFIKEHPEYDADKCTVISGSSRTGLGILGFHCGISEVISNDLSWTYEHCFPKVNIEPTDDELSINIQAIVDKVNLKLSEDPNWNEYGAVAVNNPHNASGKVFPEDQLKKLITELLNKDVFVIDDLAYQNVLPKESLQGPKTVKQITLELVDSGQLLSEQLNKVITVHSLSKTDCFAGARLAVAEINDEELLRSFREKIGSIKPNLFAILLAYLFYRNDSSAINSYWLLRNKIFKEKMDSLKKAIKELPDDRNPFDIDIAEPEGSMYPRMIINRLPNGLSLEWLSSGLASQGIGLVPLTTFARTSKGFETARKSFRLTLGGSDDANQLLRKTRRVLIDLNRMIAEEKARYNVKKLNLFEYKRRSDEKLEKAYETWNKFKYDLESSINKRLAKSKKVIEKFNHTPEPVEIFHDHHLPERLMVYDKLLEEQSRLTYDYFEKFAEDKGKILTEQLEYEFYKDDLDLRRDRFQNRLYDRTVHPTQMFSHSVDRVFRDVINTIIKNDNYSKDQLEHLSSELIEEFLGRNVAIDSIGEADELVTDLNTLISVEHFTDVYSSDQNYKSFLSFWGDWDGSSRPSGQGHRLVAAALIENVNKLSRIISVLRDVEPNINFEPELLEQIYQLPKKTNRFWKLLHEITALTNQLEQRYRSVLPFSVESGKLRKVGMRLGIASDPLTKLWQHNDSLERKMLNLRQERRASLEYYFNLNKKLRKTLYSLIPQITKNSKVENLFLEAGFYRDLLKRFILTPRIHQKLITSRDQFAINTTVHNIMEINEISGKYGNPGMVLGLQVSMSDDPQALISLDRKLNSEKEKVTRNNDNTPISSVWSIPLFEDLKTVKNVKNYLDNIWDYASQSRQLNQNTQDRFSEIICEIFVAGSDLSQQVGQLTSNTLYNQSKYEVVYWLAKKGLSNSVRMKLGSGEPMQRQGGYYAPNSGKLGFILNENNYKRLRKYLKESTIKSTEFAKTPLQGIFSGGDLRTFQSNISEQLRRLPISELAQLLNHVRETQKFYSSELLRASEPFVATRLQFQAKGIQELERLTYGKHDEVYDDFLELAKSNFQNILYGNDEDVVGIHVISYFISRTTPPLRDRPTVRPSKGGADSKGQKILEKIADTIPLSKHGSLLRAIGHNRAQSMILGVNQLTTGIFRSLEEFKDSIHAHGDGIALLQDRILPNLPVYEILQTTRIYQDCELKYLNKFLDIFPAGNSAIGTLKEDLDSMYKIIPLLQKELLRRHGIDVNEFFTDEGFIIELLPTLRTDLAVLLQPDLFNTSIDSIISNIKGNVDEEWKHQFTELLKLPNRVVEWRQKIWELLEEPVKEQVKSFIELSVALYSLSKDIDTADIRLSQSSIKKQKFETSLTDLLKGKMDDSMRQFLSAAVQYLTRLPEDMIEVPVDIIRALKDVERILRIEEQALNAQDQELLRYYILQAARLVGENG